MTAHTSGTSQPSDDVLPLERLCIHQVTLMQCDFRTSIECFSRHGVTHTSVWREKLDEVGLEDAIRILQENGVTVTSLCAGGFLTDSDPATRARSLDDNKRWLDEAAALGAQSMVTITGGLSGAPADGGNKNTIADTSNLEQARELALAGLQELIPIARSAGVKLALEPLHPMVCGFRSVISTLRDANAMLDELGAPDVMGIALDSYALWWDSQLEEDIIRTDSRLSNFHVSDWLVDTNDVRLDRGMPGDGQIDNRLIRRWVESSGFDGLVEVEIFSERNWWKREPDDVVATIVKRAKAFL